MRHRHADHNTLHTYLGQSNKDDKAHINSSHMFQMLIFMAINRVWIYIWVGCPRLSRMLLQPRDDGTATDATAAVCWVPLDRMKPCKKLGSVNCKPRRLFAVQQPLKTHRSEHTFIDQEAQQLHSI